MLVGTGKTFIYGRKAFFSMLGYYKKIRLTWVTFELNTTTGLNLNTPVF